jgi:hypothetical protein
VYNDLHPGVKSSRALHDEIANEGWNLIDKLKNQRKAIDKKTREFSNSRLDTVEEMYRFYNATNEVWKDAMKQQDSTEATRIFKEGMGRIRKLEEDKRELQEDEARKVSVANYITNRDIARAKDNPEAEAREATKAEGVATAGEAGVATAGEAGVATVGDDTAADVNTTTGDETTRVVRVAEAGREA